MDSRGNNNEARKNDRSNDLKKDTKAWYSPKAIKAEDFQLTLLNKFGCSLRYNKPRLFNPAPGFPSAVGKVKLTSGKWYFEARVFSSMAMQLGWAVVDKISPVDQHSGVGDDQYSWAWDGGRTVSWHNAQRVEFGAAWQPGDVITYAVDLDSRPTTMTVYLNGAWLGVVFSNMAIGSGIAPAATLATSQIVDLNFGEYPMQYPMGNGYSPITQQLDPTKIPPDVTIIPNARSLRLYFDKPLVYNRESVFLSAKSDVHLNSGKWHYEVWCVTDGVMQVGWAVADAFNPALHDDMGVGDDAISWSYDGSRQIKFHCANGEKYGRHWKVGDVVGCTIDLDASPPSN